MSLKVLQEHFPKYKNLTKIFQQELLETILITNPASAQLSLSDQITDDATNKVLSFCLREEIVTLNDFVGLAPNDLDELFITKGRNIRIKNEIKRLSIIMFIY